jgi:N-methylhydantoinase B
VKVNPITLEVIHNEFLSIAEEMGISLQKAAYSSNIKTRLDFACAIFDDSFRNIVQALHIPSMLGALVSMVPACIQEYGLTNLREGDGLVMNDPHKGGTHLPDIALISPVFYKSRIFGYVANIAHHQDVGGRSPGSVPGDATDIYQEGLVIPPLRLIRQGQLQEPLLTLLLANVRAPKKRMGDYRAQLAANTLGLRRLQHLLTKYSIETLQTYMNAILSYTERRMRTALQEIPPGCYTAEDYLDGDGITREPVKIATEITIQDDIAIIDLSSSDQQGPGPMNATMASTLSAISYIFKCLIDPAIPVNHGLYQPLHIIAPRGSVVHAQPPAAIAGCWEVAQRICDVLVLALAEALPQKVCAAGKGIICNISFGGINPQTQDLYTFYETIGGGYGARPNLDGMDAVQYHLTNTQNAPIEEIELQYPILIERYELLPNTEGPGKYRGGLGLRRDYRFKDHSVTFSVLSDRTRFAPWGLFRGLAAQPSKYIVNPNSPDEIQLWSKHTILLKPNDLVTIQTPGGGGYGDPKERDPQLVLEDVRNGKITRSHAAQFYGVVINFPSLTVDWSATTQLRHQFPEA